MLRGLPAFCVFYRIVSVIRTIHHDTLKSLLRLDAISTSYGNTRVLNDIDIDVKEGEFFFLLGPSGCGKTTLLRILSGLMHPDEGTVWLGGKDITRLPAHQRDINTVFQNYALFPHLNVYDNVAFGLRMKKRSEPEIRSKVEEALRLVSLPDFGKRMPTQMSGGQMQRVALARAIVNEPAVLLLDEPLGALDVKLRKQMQFELKQLQRKLGTTFICVTHDQDEAMTLGDRIAVMNHGRFEQIADAHTLYNQPASHFVCDFLGDCNFLQAVVNGRIDDKLSLTAEGNPISASAPQTTPSGACIIGVRPEKISLDGSRENRVEASVEQVVFTGSHYTVIAKTSRGTSLSCRMFNDRPSALPETGQAITLSWHHTDTIVLPPNLSQSQ